MRFGPQRSPAADQANRSKAQSGVGTGAAAGSRLCDLALHGVYRPRPLQIRADRILRIQGYVAANKIRPAIREAAERCARRAIDLADPVLHYRRVPVTAIEEDRLFLESGATLSCVAFPKYLSGCQEVVIFVMTLGPAFDAAVIALSEEFDLLDALLLETAGWLCIEAATKSFADDLRTWARGQGLAVSLRMGPGYGYRLDGKKVSWSLDDQKPLFGLFGDAALPVQLLESCAMLPKMSRSGLFGLLPNRAGPTLAGGGCA
jgi:hypothetical protein